MKLIGPPKWADRFLTWYCRPDKLENIQGDVYELFYRNLKLKNKSTADWNFVWNVLRFFRWSNIKRTRSQSSTIMIYRNYFSVFKRSLIKQKGYSFLNISGLAIGIACFLLISFYIKDEISYDRLHSKADRIYRMHEIWESDGIGERSASLPFQISEMILQDYNPQVVSAVRFFNMQIPTLSISTIDDTKAFNESRVFFADSTLFDVFDFKLIKGNKKTALDNMHSILLTSSMAKKYFGDEDPIGKYLKLQGNINLLITGVLEEVPPNAHFQFDFLISFSTVKEFFGGQVPNGWSWNPCWTYFLLRDKRDAPSIQALLPSFVQKYYPANKKNEKSLHLFPLTDIHLKSNMDYEISANASLNTIYIFGSVALFVILIACINFINLSTARATKRAKEVGMRKVLGSDKIQLIAQFLFESIAFCFLSVILAIVLLLIALPYFNSLTEKNISLFLLTDSFFIVGLIMLPITVGIISGIYPAFILSSFKPVTALKGGAVQEKGAFFRKTLVITQFSLSIILIICTGVAIDQLNLLQKSDPGFTKENVILIPISRTPIAKNYEVLKNEFLQNHNVLSVTAMEEVLGSKHQVNNYIFEGLTESKPFPSLHVRHDFLKTFNIPIVAGRDYSQDYVTDDSLALLVNEQFVKQMGWKSNEEAIGKAFTKSSAMRSNRKITGVVKDFNFTSKHQAIRPLILDLNLNPNAFNVFLKYMAVRISPENATASIEWLNEKWKAKMPGWPFEYFFLDKNLDALYKNENKMSKTTIVFSVLSILVACLGLFGLATFTAEQRKKEMSIRKVLGSADSQIFFLFSKQFFNLVIIANILAFPVAYLVLKRWLSGFAYQVSIDWSLFLLAAIASMVITVVTICYQGLRTAHTNPAEVLKNE